MYVVSLVWCLVALDLARRLPETRRFTAAHITRATHRPRINRRRLGLLAAVAFIGNIFIAPASFFQNRYLTDVQGFSGGMIGLFSIAVGTPAGIGLIVGGRIADTSGRRRLIAFALPVSTIAIVGAFMVSGVSLWILSLVGGVIASAAYPALAVYRVELFPTGNRSRAAGLVTAASLIGGVIGLISMGALLDADWSFGAVLALLGTSQFIVTVLVVKAYPETAHQELEALNPEDVEFSPADWTGDQAPVIWPMNASAASAIAASAPLRSWPLRSIHRWVTGAGMVAVHRSSSSGAPNGSFVPEMNRHGTSIAGRCSTRRLSGLPGGCSG